MLRPRGHGKRSESNARVTDELTLELLRSGAGGPILPACKVKSFKMKFNAWDISWPWSSWLGPGTTIRLPVEFTLELDASCTRADCMIGQLMRGRTESGGRGEEITAWKADGEAGNANWWDGKDWQGGGGASWSWSGEKATFYDKPGFNRVPLSAYPLYWGGLGRKHHFQFRTVVKDRRTVEIVSELAWGILIDYSAPEKGSHYFYTF